MSDLFDRNYTCPVCEYSFTSKQVKTSAVRTKERRKDFHAIFNGSNPTFYGVICCSRCGYTKFESDFKVELSVKDKEAIKQGISMHWKPQDFCGERDIESAIRVHKIALASYKITHAKHSLFGKLYLRLAWFYDECGNEIESKRFTEMALNAFVNSYELEKHEGDEREKELEIIYLIGELNRQLGAYKEAIRWFDMTIRHEFAYKNRLLKTYAKDQWALAAEEYAQRKVDGSGR